MSSENGHEEQQCGCKGVRYCKLCESSDRVRNLERGPAVACVEVIQPWRNYTTFVYCHKCAHAIPASINNDFSYDSVVSKCESVSTQSCDEHVGCSESFPIAGLPYVPDLITENEEEYLCDVIARQTWVVSQSGRRKQDYGPRVNFKKHKVKLDSFVGMPEYADFVLDRMRDRCPQQLSDYIPFEMCNLEYAPERGSSIDFHVDDLWIWGNRLISINLMAGSIMSIIQESTSRLVFINMQRRSLLCMMDEARFEWKHGILPEHITHRRVALTMREPATDFQPGGSLYDKYGSDLIDISQKRVQAIVS